MKQFKFNKAPDGSAESPTFNTWDEVDRYTEELFYDHNFSGSIERTEFGNGYRQISLKDIKGKIIYQIKEN